MTVLLPMISKIDSQQVLWQDFKPLIYLIYKRAYANGFTNGGFYEEV